MIINYIVMIQSVSLNFQSLDQMRDFLQDQLNSADLSLQLPPFLTSFYHPLRKRLYQGFRVSLRPNPAAT